MNRESGMLIAAVALGAIALWLLLPRGEARGRRLGAVLGLVSLGLLAARLSAVGDWGEHALFLALAGVTVISAAGTVTLRNPVYSAIWFAMSLLGTAGLFLAQGAQFLGVATIVVYAGAILVTFLFVLMLANPSGHAWYDRLSWEAPLSAATGAAMIGVLTAVLAGGIEALPPQDSTPAVAVERRQEGVLADQHMAHLGGQLFSRHLVAIEVAGTLLLAALVGAVAIAAHGKRVES